MMIYVVMCMGDFKTGFKWDLLIIPCTATRNQNKSSAEPFFLDYLGLNSDLICGLGLSSGLNSPILNSDLICSSCYITSFHV
jgi:hypothetical protein